MNYSNLPFVSVIIPCRNEEKFISVCLNSIIKNDYPKERLEILVVDGMSEDKTREIVEKYTRQYPFVKLLENPKKITPAAMNIGIKNSKGEIIIKMDAHTIYEKDYISKCVKYLKESGADNVGGVLKSIPSDKTLIAKAIAICLSHSFGAGGSYFRIGSKKIREVDTVSFGCYRKETFNQIGTYNENMVQSEDMELNQRLKKSGGRILLFPDIIAYYYPSSKNFKEFFLHNFQDGIWTIYPLKFGIRIFSFRHLLPLFFVLTFPLNFWLYFLVSLFFSFKIAFREKDFRFFFLMPIAFFCRHFGYGFGSLWGLVKIFSK